MYACNDYSSFENLPKIIEKILDIERRPKLMFLIGTKSDLPERKVSYEDAKSFAYEYGMKLFFETSSKEKINIKESFLTIISTLEKELKHAEKVEQEEFGTIIHLENKSYGNRTKCAQ